MLKSPEKTIYQTVRLLLLFFYTILIVSCSSKQELKPAEAALHNYLNNGDKTYSWEVRDSYNLYQVRAYRLYLTSQKWHEYTWKHNLTILVPDENNFDGALLFVTSGKNKDGEPVDRSGDPEFIYIMSQVAKKNKAIVAIIWQVPNQPLFNGLTEDALISYTLYNFKNDGDYSWPLLFPMVKSAVRAMDAVQDFSKETLNHEISRFTVTGASKRGWTSWLTGAADSRVEAIAPMVIDVLNMPVNLDYQLETWGDYSIQIEDYVKLGIPQEVHTGSGNEITTMIDPYSYRDKLNMPKLIIIGTNDEYWPVDAVKNYIDDIPGNNFIHYEPNAGHGLNGGENALKAITAFWGRTLSHTSYPVCNWHLTQNENQFTISVETSPEELIAVKLWTANSEDRDFRDELWTSKNIRSSGNKFVDVQVNLPSSGFLALYIDLTYPDLNGVEYTKSTRMFVANNAVLLTDLLQ
jgi:PhoPQ-activated pathogenicity-related protein